MRLMHLVGAVAFIALGLTLWREPMTRVFIIVFVTGLGEITFGLVALMALFQTIGALGEAEEAVEHLEAIVATSAVLALASAVMSAWLFAGVWVVFAST